VKVGFGKSVKRNDLWKYDENSGSKLFYQRKRPCAAQLSELTKGKSNKKHCC
jgi:hypothetical protein